MRIKTIALSAASVGYGALFAWALTTDRYEHQLVAVDKVLRYYEDRIYALENPPEEPDYKDPAEKLIENQLAEEEAILDGETAEPEEVEEIRGETEAQTRSNLQRIIDQYTAEGSDAEPFVNIASAETHNEDPPFVISQATYSWDEEGEYYSKITVTYYPRHKILLEDDEPIDDIPNTVGWKNLNRFGDESGDPLVVFVRNRRLGIDYEVVREEDGDIPRWVALGMSKEEYRINRASGLLALDPGE